MQPNSCNIAANINPLSSNGFKFSVERIPEISYFCQEANIPEITAPSARMDTPLSKIPLSGDKLSFAPLRVQFLIDSEMKNYKALFNWIRGVGFPDDHEQYTEQVSIGKRFNRQTQGPATLSNATLGVLNNVNHIIAIIAYTDCTIVSLGGFNMTSRDPSVEYLTGTAIFEYQSYDIEIVG